MSEPKRILQVLTIMNLGGAETMIMNYYRSIDRSKIQFDFLLHRPERGAYDDEIENLGGKIYRMPPISPRNFFKYKSELKKFFYLHPEYEIVHSHLNSLSTFVLNAAKATSNVRIGHSHIAINPIKLSDFFNKKLDLKTTIKEALQTLLRKSVANYATHYFACGEKAGKWMFGDTAEKPITVINNAIDSSRFIYNNEIATITKKKLKIEDKLVIGHVGRFNDQKNHFFLIEIFNEILKANSNAILLLVGEGDLRPKIEDEINKLGITEAVMFLGSRTDIPELLQSFDVFLFPSLYEGLPVTLIEAQAAGLKIIASDTISSEVNFSKLIQFIALKESSLHWAKQLLQSIKYKRENTQKIVIDSGYDIVNNAKNLEDFYLKNSN